MFHQCIKVFFICSHFQFPLGWVCVPKPTTCFCLSTILAKTLYCSQFLLLQSILIQNSSILVWVVLKPSFQIVPCKLLWECFPSIYKETHVIACQFGQNSCYRMEQTGSQQLNTMCQVATNTLTHKKDQQLQADEFLQEYNGPSREEIPLWQHIYSIQWL